MSFRKSIVSQFQHPRGWLGRIVGWILAGRGSNLTRNRRTVELLNPASGERVLEVGCGPGIALQLCLSRRGVSAVGVDHSSLMISQARKRNARAVQQERLTLTVGTIEDVPAMSGPFDKIFSINVIQFVEQDKFISQAEALLKPGGLFAATYQPRHAKATRDDALKMAASLSEILRAQGFTDVRTEEIALKPVPAVVVLARRGV